MDINYTNTIAKKLFLDGTQVINTIKLFEEGATIPFISRYRKERTGSLDEVKIAEIKEMLEKLRELDKRRTSILESIEKQGKLDEDLRERINRADSLTILEDIYLPYKQKRKTRAFVARENGLEPLALIIFKQKEKDLFVKAETFISDNAETIDDVLQGARDIIAEWINENETARKQIRSLFDKTAFITSVVIKGKEEEGEKFQDYFDSTEGINKCASHRFLAISRGEETGILRVHISPEAERAIVRLEELFIKSDNNCSAQVRIAARDSYKRLLVQ